MKRALLAAVVCVAIAGGACGLAYAQLQVDRQPDPSPVIHGSSDQTIVPTTYKPRHKLPGYPITRLPEASK